MPDFNLELVDERAAARILGFSVKSLRNRRWKRQPPSFLKLGRKIAYRLSDLQAYLDACTIEPMHKG